MNSKTIKRAKLQVGSSTIVVLEGQVAIYARKSVMGESSHQTIEDQVTECLEVCQSLSLPASELDVLAEKPGHSGAEFWEGGGILNQLNLKAKKRTRPKLTELVNRINDGSVKVLVVRDQSRLWRSVEICGALVELLSARKVFLFDRFGHVNIETPDGRQQVNHAAAAAQNYRETCVVNTNYWIKKKKLRGGVVGNNRVLGFRHLKGSGIEAVKSELLIVSRIFRMFVDGDGNGPMTITNIARCLTQDGTLLAWIKESRRMAKVDQIHGFQVSPQFVKAVLTRPQYIGKQKGVVKGELLPSPSFLVDGQTAVDLKTWSMAQAKIGRNILLPSRRIQSSPLSGLLRCAYCSHSFFCNHHGSTKSWHHRPGLFKCPSRMPVIRGGLIEKYISEHLAPLLLAELNEKERRAQARSKAEKLGLLEIERDELLGRKEIELKQFTMTHWKNHPELVTQMSDYLDEELQRIRNEMRMLENGLKSYEEEVRRVKHLTKLTENHLRDAFRSVFRWIVVLPEDQAQKGKLLFLTKWGTYHTAVFEKSDVIKREKRKTVAYKLRTARIDEVLSSVKSLPKPDAFVFKLSQSYEFRVRNMKFDTQVWAPGLFEGDIQILSTSVPRFATGKAVTGEIAS